MHIASRKKIENRCNTKQKFNRTRAKSLKNGTCTDCCKRKSLGNPKIRPGPDASTGNLLRKDQRSGKDLAGCKERAKGLRGDRTRGECWDVPRRTRASFPGEPTYASRCKTALRMHHTTQPWENSSATFANSPGMPTIFLRARGRKENRAVVTRETLRILARARSLRSFLSLR